MKCVAHGPFKFSHICMTAKYVFLEYIVGECPGSLYDERTALHPVPAFFWSFMPGLEVEVEGEASCKLPVMTRLGLKSPRVDLIRHEEVTIIAVRGTQSKRDAVTNVRVTMTDATLRRRVKAQLDLCPTTAPIRSAVCRVLDALLADNGWRVHRGMFVRSVGVAVSVCAVQTTDVLRFYGHSLGAACACMAFALISEAYPSKSCSAAVVSCPNFCNEKTRLGWLSPHGDDGHRYRHYYTHGDPVVITYPKAVNLHRGMSLTSYVCPLTKIKGFARAFGRLLAHVMFQPLLFRKKVIGGAFDEATEDSSDVGCDGLHGGWEGVVLVDPKYRY